MSTVSLVTADELLALPAGMGARYELLAGELRVFSAHRWRHGQVVGNLQAILSAYIRAKRIGRGFGAETGFLIARNPDTVRAPDFAFIANELLPSVNPDEAFWPGAPDLAVEVLSPNDRTGEVDEKIAARLVAGCAAVWVIDPSLETVVIYRSRTDVRVLTAGEQLDGESTVSGFSCPVDELFR